MWVLHRFDFIKAVHYVYRRNALLLGTYYKAQSCFDPVKLYINYMTE